MDPTRGGSVGRKSVKRAFAVARGLSDALGTVEPPLTRDEALAAVGAFYTLVPIRPRWRGERDSLRTFPGVSLRPGSLGFNPRPRRLSTPTDAFESHPDIRSYGTTLRHGIREASVDRITPLCVNAAVAGVKVGDEVERGETRVSVVFVRKERR